MWPYVCRVAVWERAVNDDKPKPESVCRRCFPFGVCADFAPKDPILMGFEDVDEQGKVAMCERVLYKEIIVALIRDGVNQ